MCVSSECVHCDMMQMFSALMISINKVECVVAVVFYLHVSLNCMHTETYMPSNLYHIQINTLPENYSNKEQHREKYH